MNKYFLSLMAILILFQTFRVYDEIFFKEEDKEKGYKILSESKEDLKIDEVKEANLQEKIDIQSLVLNGNLENGKKISKQCSSCHDLSNNLKIFSLFFVLNSI